MGYYKVEQRWRRCKTSAKCDIVESDNFKDCQCRSSQTSNYTFTRNVAESVDTKSKNVLGRAFNKFERFVG